MCTNLTRVATHFIAAQPVKHTEATRQCDTRTQRTQITTEETFDKQTGNQQSCSKQYKPPFAHKLQNNCGFERFNFCKFFSSTQIVQGNSQQTEEDNVFNGCQARMQQMWHSNLFYAQFFSNTIGQLLQ